MGYNYLTIHGPISIDIHSYTFDIVLMWGGSPPPGAANWEGKVSGSSKWSVKPFLIRELFDSAPSHQNYFSSVVLRNHYLSPLVQLVERQALNLDVGGSSPSGAAKNNARLVKRYNSGFVILN